MTPQDYADIANDHLTRLADDLDASESYDAGVGNIVLRALLTSKREARHALLLLAEYLPIGYEKGRAEGQAICLQSRSEALDSTLASARACIGRSEDIRRWASEWRAFART